MENVVIPNIDHTRGDTLVFRVNLKETTTKEPLDLDVSQIQSQIRDPFGNLVDEFDINKTLTTGTYLFKAKTDTSNYPLDKSTVNVKFTEDDFKQSSKPFTITVNEGPTR